MRLDFFKEYKVVNINVLLFVPQQVVHQTGQLPCRRGVGPSGAQTSSHSSVEDPQPCVGFTYSWSQGSQQDRRTIDHVSGPAVQHPSSADLISRAKPQPRAKGLGITPATHVQSDFGNNNEHTHHV